MQLAATIERAEKQLILARHGRRILNLLDDTPLVPGETRRPYESTEQGKQILEEAEQELRSWEPSMEPVQSSAREMGAGTLPSRPREQEREREPVHDTTMEQYVDASDGPREEYMYEKDTLVVEPGAPGPQIAS